MMALSMYPPYPTLVRLGVKTVETRPRSMSHRGELGLHTTFSVPGMKRGERQMIGEYELERDDPLGSKRPAYLLRGPRLAWPYRVPTGAIEVVCSVVDEVPIVLDPEAVVGPLCIATAEGGVHVLDSSGRQLDLPGQAPYGDYRPGRFATLLSGVRGIDPPSVRPPGEWHRGLWGWTP
jgi:hypothetical protein